MNFGDFVEKMEETPICNELKQVLDKWYEWYVKDPEKCMEEMLTRGGSKNYLFAHFIFLANLYERSNKE